MQRLYGTRSEKLHAGQLALFGEDTDEAPASPVDSTPDNEEVLERVRKKREPRVAKTRVLPRERIVSPTARNRPRGQD